MLSESATGTSSSSVDGYANFEAANAAGADIAEAATNGAAGTCGEEIANNH